MFDPTITLTPCLYEDGPAPCYWDASTMGNGVGQSFVLLEDETLYVEPCLPSQGWYLNEETFFCQQDAPEPPVFTAEPAPVEPAPVEAAPPVVEPAPAPAPITETVAEVAVPVAQPPMLAETGPLDIAGMVLLGAVLLAVGSIARR